MTTSHITFPLEFVEAFVEKLAPGNGIVLEREIFRTLIACTLASKHFSLPARKRLFSTLVVDRERKHLLQKTTSRNKTRSEEEMSRRINSFLDLLADEQSSDLALMVRRLHIIVDSERVILQEATNLHELLRALSHRAHNLSSLRLHVYGIRSLSWTRIPQRMADGLQALCRSLPMHRLNFSRVHNIPPTIASAQDSPHLRYIDFKDSNFEKIDAGLAAETNISPATSLITGHLEVLRSLPTHGIYEICYTSNGKTHIVDIDVTTRLFDDSQRLYQLLSNCHVHASLKNCRLIFGANYEPLFATKGIDFGTMVLLRQLVLEIRVGLYQRYEDITNGITSIINCLHYGDAKSALEEIKVTLNVQRVKYRGTSMFDPVDFSPIKGLRIDSLLGKHPLIQKTKFCMIIGLMQRDAGPEVNDESRLSFEEHIRDLIIDSGLMTAINPENVPPIDDSLFPKIHICAKSGH
ncbi:hypothetical protein CVT25_013151 [Psilocybe cyanescens]|uniref:Uncharacterized protein n=1 Tax=Psilocybe cyanescens TaxID=93625 RepID=A0A409XK11_PSICY|nr:hypothetical protein CVT25_013151 [Psilocybe cyanescens]